MCLRTILAQYHCLNHTRNYTRAPVFCRSSLFPACTYVSSSDNLILLACFTSVVKSCRNSHRRTALSSWFPIPPPVSLRGCFCWPRSRTDTTPGWGKHKTPSPVPLSSYPDQTGSTCINTGVGFRERGRRVMMPRDVTCVSAADGVWLWWGGRT